MKRLCRACQDWHDLDEPWPAACTKHFPDRSERSGLSAPRIISDAMEAVRCMADGKMYESKSAMSAAHKARGLIEVGNDLAATMQHATLAPPRPKITKADVAAAVNKVKNGYKPQLPASLPDL